MSDRLKFFKSLLPILNSDVPYSIFNYNQGMESFSEDIASCDILLPYEYVEPLLQSIRKEQNLERINLYRKFSHSRAELRFSEGIAFQINFIHRFLFKTLAYLRPEEVFNKRVCNIELGFNQVSLEHSFEYSILSCYLNKEGWNENYYQYFEEFHVLIKEDLLEYFNRKYQSGFRSFEDLLDFSVRKEEKIINSLRGLPYNAFLETMTVRVNNFFGFRSRAIMF